MKKIGHVFLFFLCFSVAIYAMAYWGFDRMSLLLTKPEEVFSDTLFRFSFYGHIFFGPIALLSGPFQFMPNFRNKRMGLHRVLGKIYVTACLFSGVAGLSAAQFATGGTGNKLGFSFLAIAWITATILAFLKIRQRDIQAHEEWMIRSFALTFSAVTLRLQLGIYQGFLGLTFLESYAIVAWSCWIPNLLVAEWWIRSKRKPRVLLPA